MRVFKIQWEWTFSVKSIFRDPFMPLYETSCKGVTHKDASVIDIHFDGLSLKMALSLLILIFFLSRSHQRDLILPLNMASFFAIHSLF